MIQLRAKVIGVISFVVHCNRMTGQNDLTGKTQKLQQQAKSLTGHVLWLLTLQYDVARITALFFLLFLVHSNFDNMAVCARL
jgi:hypothetical protein